MTQALGSWDQISQTSSQMFDQVSKPQFSPSEQWGERCLHLKDIHSNEAQNVRISYKNPRLLLPYFLYAELVAVCPHLTLSQPQPQENEAHNAEDREGEVEAWTWA